MEPRLVPAAVSVDFPFVGDELRQLPFVCAISELPTCPFAAGPLPIDKPHSEDFRDVGREAGVAASVCVELEAELPGRLDEEGQEVLAVVVALLEVCPFEDPGAESFGIANVVEREFSSEQAAVRLEIRSDVAASLTRLPPPQQQKLRQP